MFLDSTKASCPYCGELIEFLIEPLDSCQEYIEDCQVCCQPILIKISPAEDGHNYQFMCYRTDDTN